MKKLLIVFSLPFLTFLNYYSKPAISNEASTTFKGGSGSDALNIMSSRATKCHNGWSSAGPCTTSNKTTPRGQKPLTPFLGVTIKESNDANGVLITNII